MSDALKARIERHLVLLVSASIIGVGFLFLIANTFPLGKQLDAPLHEVFAGIDLWWVRFRGGFEKGVLNLKDVIYYVAVTYFFLLLATKAMEAKRWQ